MRASFAGDAVRNARDRMTLDTPSCRASSLIDNPRFSSSALMSAGCQSTP